MQYLITASSCKPCQRLKEELEEIPEGVTVIDADKIENFELLNELGAIKNNSIAVPMLITDEGEYVMGVLNIVEKIRGENGKEIR